METEKTLSDIEKLSKIADILGYDLTEKAEDEDQQYADYDEFLNECYSEEKDRTVCGCSITPSELIKQEDPVRYRCGFSDWLDSECQNGRYIEIDDGYYTEDNLNEAQEELKDLIDSLDFS